MENSKKSGIAKLKKLGLTDEEINSMLGIEEIPPEEELEEAEEKSQLETVAWKKDFLIEQLGHYNKKHGGEIELEDWVVGIQSGEIDVHFDWKELAGIRPNPLNDPNSPEFKKREIEEEEHRKRIKEERIQDQILWEKFKLSEKNKEK